MKRLLNCILILLLHFFSFDPSVCAQKVKAQVIDEITKAPLVYATVGIENSAKGTITNEEGYFILELSAQDSFLILSYVGYESKKVPVSTLLEQDVVTLNPAEINLVGLVVHGDDNFIRDLILAVGKNIRNSASINSKAYMKVQSDELNRPIELIECYYNALSNQSGLKNLALKNGRAGVYIEKGKSYHSMSTSKFFEEFNVAEKRDYMPYNPFQLRKGELNRFYTFQQLSTLGDSLSHVSFKSVENKTNFFSGDCWIDTRHSTVKQLNLTIENAAYFPLKPIWSGDKLENIRLDASLSFERVEGSSALNHIKFTYSFEYVHQQNKDYAISAPDHKRKIKGSGLLYLFDYKKQFIIPSYKYDPEISDYNQINLASVNGDFWKLNQGLPHTKVEMQKLAYFGQKGILLNHFTQNNEIQRHMDSVQYTLASILWRDSVRINVLYDINIDTIPDHVHQLTLHRDYYNLEVQIYMDINETKDGLQYFTATILDAIQTYYLLPKEDYSNAFINIYFDICEIERRKMEKIIEKGPITVERLQEAYKQAMLGLRKITDDYLTDVDRGRERNKLRYWNDYVEKELGIDNFRMFGMSN